MAKKLCDKKVFLISVWLCLNEPIKFNRNFPNMLTLFVTLKILFPIIIVSSKASFKAVVGFISVSYQLNILL